MIYIPNAKKQMRTPVTLMKPAETKRYNGVTYHEGNARLDVIFVNWKSFGGTETVVNGVPTIEDTAQVTTRYRPDIKSDCRIQLSDGRIYEIIGEPENPDMANRYLIFKVKRLKGGL
ncbi:MAG: phage head closure protein [Oscillospiraceae bacterium]